MSRVVLAMSGGVDSSVAAHLLRAAGHEVIGLFMRHGQAHEAACATDSALAASSRLNKSAIRDPQSAIPAPTPLTPHPSPLTVLAHKQGCCTASDAADARRVADRLDIPFYALNFEEEFGRIMDYFVEEYTSGRTPNPCVVCNNWLKFGRLADYADSVGADYIATGHYARLVCVAGEMTPALCRGLDPAKDQSYVLFGIDRAILPRLLFPVGEYRKDQIRDMARGLSLRVAEKKDSQEICFVADGDYARFVHSRRGERDTSGEIVTTDGEIVGRHEGLEGFTVGQRKGLGVALGEPRYVVRLERDTRRVVIGRREELARTGITAAGANWLIDQPREPFRCTVKIRYLSQQVGATVTPLAGGRLQANLDQPKHGVAPGQALVCYRDDRVLGGGWIE